MPTPTENARLMCDKCEKRMVRSNRLGFFFFMGAAIFCGVMTVIFIIGDIRGGAGIHWQTILMLIGVGVVGPVQLALSVKDACRFGE